LSPRSSAACLLRPPWPCCWKGEMLIKLVLYLHVNLLVS
jgi:hypothetical protein